MKNKNINLGKRYEEIGEEILKRLNFKIIETPYHPHRPYDRVVTKEGKTYIVEIRGSGQINANVMLDFQKIFGLSYYDLPILLLIVNDVEEYALLGIDILSVDYPIHFNHLNKYGVKKRYGTKNTSLQY